MFPPSHISTMLYFIKFINKDFASYFYPFGLVCNTVGLFVIFFLITEKDFRRFFFNTIKYDILGKLNNKSLKKLFLFFYIFGKFFMLYTYPVNLSAKAFRYSGYVLLFYILLITFLYFNYYYFNLF